MSKMISARVPDALYDQVSKRLTDLGSNTSDLVNAAFEYVLKENSLPEVSNFKTTKSRTLSKAQKKRLDDLFQNCTLGIDIPDDAAYDKHISRLSRIEKYENPA